MRRESRGGRLRGGRMIAVGSLLLAAGLMLSGVAHAAPPRLVQKRYFQIAAGGSVSVTWLVQLVAFAP